LTGGMIRQIGIGFKLVEINITGYKINIHGNIRMAKNIEILGKM